LGEDDPAAGREGRPGAGGLRVGQIPGAGEPAVQAGQGIGRIDRADDLPELIGGRVEAGADGRWV
jgi:hypothetical protein